MKDEQISVLDAALGVFLRYGFKRTTMGDIAQAAGLSRQSLYARFPNKDEVFAAGYTLYVDRTLADLKAAWEASPNLAAAFDAFADISLRPTFEMLQTFPDANDIVDGVETTAGKIAETAACKKKREIWTDMLADHAPALASHGLTPEDAAQFIDMSKEAIVRTAVSKDDLERQIATLKAAVLALTNGGSAA